MVQTNEMSMYHEFANRCHGTSSTSTGVSGICHPMNTMCNSNWKYLPRTCKSPLVACFLGLQQKPMIQNAAMSFKRLMVNVKVSQRSLFSIVERVRKMSTKLSGENSKRKANDLLSMFCSDNHNYPGDKVVPAAFQEYHGPPLCVLSPSP